MKPRPPVMFSSKRPTVPSVNQAPPKPATMPASVTLM
jgi:hypothetical protein